MAEKLALNGGPKAVKTDFSKLPSKIGPEELVELVSMWDFSPDTKAKIINLIQSDKNLRGPHLFRYYNPKPSRVEAAEAAMRSLIGSKHCLATNSCTSALVAAYRALGIGAGDEVIVPAYTFFATAAAVVAANAIPVIVDIDETLCLDPEQIKKALTPRTKAIVPVHMRGAMAQIDEIIEIGNQKGIPVVEDVAQAAGASFRGQRLGSFGALGCFSFDYYKVIVSGEGGFITTDDEWLYTRAQSWHDTAACWRPNRFAQERRQGELFCGENYRMSELEGAVALAQINKADRILAGHRRAKHLIKSNLEKFPGLSFRRIPDETGDTGITLTLFLPDPEITQKATKALQAEGVPAGGIYDKKVRDWHTYNYWDHILEKKAVAKDGLPWSAVPADQLPRYSRDMCPRVGELLARAILIDIDSHLPDPACLEFAQAINKVMSALLK